MARKKPHEDSSSFSRSDTAVVVHSVGDLLSAAPAKPPSTVSPAANSAERFWLQPVAIRALRLLGSLQVAIFLLSFFAFVLAIGTMLESWYSDKVAKDLLYRTWWFKLLLLALGVNIFFAAAKKWPWKKQQTGFIITHIGLLTMVFGGMLTSLGGTDTAMILIDSPDLQLQERRDTPQASSDVTDRDTSALRVRMPKPSSDNVLEFPISPGSLPWRADNYFEPRLDPMLRLLDLLDSPFPKHFRKDLDDRSSVEVLNYYPHVRQEKFRPADADDSEPFPAVKLLLKSSMMKLPPEHWVADSPKYATSAVGTEEMTVGLVQMLGKCPEGMVDEFRSPPPVEGSMGLLALRIAGAIYRFDVERNLNLEAKPLGDSGWKTRLTSYQPSAPLLETSVSPKNPLIDFELTAPDGAKATYGILGRMPGRIFALDGQAAAQPDLSFQAWYHAPDQRFGDTTTRAVLQLAIGPAEEILYRAYSSRSGKFTLDGSGVAKKDEAADDDEAGYPIWSPAAGWKFRIAKYLPQAVAEPWFLPVQRRPGLEDPEGKIQPALRCKLHSVGKAKEFWVGRTKEEFSRVKLGNKVYEVGFNDKKTHLGFEIKLLRAETLVDPGTEQKAGYTSWVKVTDLERKLKGEDRLVTMNQPLDYGGLKFYQSGLNPAGFDQSSLKPINYSIFTVSHDPGLWFEYVGSSMLALGIGCMFYMKAYFFKPRGRSPARSEKEMP